jgi:hypothetical protein
LIDERQRMTSSSDPNYVQRIAFSISCAE